MKPKKEVQTVVVGMSGGVDSSVTALLLKKQGYNVIGMFMKNWDEEVDGVCTAQKDFDDVALVSKQIGIPFYPITFSKEYKERVFEGFIDELKKGNTPNPDILCNKEIKFSLLLESAQKLGADALATGHYAKNEEIDGLHYLMRPCDKAKDQTYFLYTITQDILSKVLFPLQDLPKSEIRKIAKEANLIVSEKRDSTGICFIGKRNFKEFISNYIQYSPGEFRLIDNEKVVGSHCGVAYYTIGQRRGLAIGGPGDAYFVVDKDVEKNIVYVAQGKNHPALFAHTLVASDVAWISKEPETTSFRCSAKIRYRTEDKACTVEKITDGTYSVTFDKPERAITCQQSIVFYDGDICLGGGFITKRGPTLFS